jgi:hypothetical protein
MQPWSKFGKERGQNISDLFHSITHHLPEVTNKEDENFKHKSLYVFLFLYIINKIKRSEKYFIPCSHLLCTISYFLNLNKSGHSVYRIYEL